MKLRCGGDTAVINLMRFDESNLIQPRGAITRRRGFDALTPPSWVARWLGASDNTIEASGDDWALENGDAHGFAQLCIRDAAHLTDGAFEAAVSDAVERLAAMTREYRMGAPVRFWNFVPRIHARSDTGGNRYMVFNAGRQRAFSSWPVAPFDTRLIPASAVDHRGEDLLIQMLTAHAPARPIENPRQRPAHRYSRRYGIIAPSFARAGVIADERSLITAGTASVVGEDSRHIDDLAAQFREIEINLATLVAAAGAGKPDIDRIERDPARRLKLLAAYRHLRAYVVHTDHERATARWMASSFPNAEECEVVPADLCRRDLLVEVEGLAVLEPGDDAARHSERT